MRAAQISLTNYFVSELQFTANQAFDSDKPSRLEIADLQLTRAATAKTEDRRNWELNLRVALNASPERNLPCSFVVSIVGFISVDSSVSDENVERFVNINGTSLVFSAAREIVRAVTSRGPFRSILLPTITFWEAKPEKPSQPAEVEEPEKDEAATNSVQGSGLSPKG